MALELLNAQQINHYLSASVRELVAELILFDEVDSTNHYLLRRGRVVAGKAVVCLAEFQSQGRGRLGRHWVSPYGMNICLSVLWHFATNPNHLSGLSLVVGLAVRRALVNYGLPQSLQVKWPNDLLYANAKLAGVLIESKSPTRESAHAVIGIGVNLNKVAIEQQDYASIDVASILQQPVARNQLIALLLNELVPALQRFATEGFKIFVTEWRQHDAMMNKKVKVLTGQDDYLGIVRGIGPSGELLVENEQGELKSLVTGEVSLRLLN